MKLCTIWKFICAKRTIYSFILYIFVVDAYL
jgi:hypothetical protein